MTTGMVTAASGLIGTGLSGDAVAVGIDVGGTKTLGVALSSGQIIGRVQIPTQRGADGVVATVREVHTRLQVQTPGRPVVAIGLGIPGMVDVEAGVVSHAVNLDLDAFPLVQALEAQLGVRVALENDVNAAALGASAQLGATSSLALLNLGTGLAVGIVLDGIIHRGSSSAAGEIGHLPVDPHGELCACGQRGCLELLVSGTAFRRIVESDPASVTALLDTAHVDRRRHPFVAFFDRLAWTVQLVALSLDVQRVVLVGGITSYGPAFERALLAALQRRAATSPFIASLDLSSRVSVLEPGYPYGAVGAAVHGFASREADAQASGSRASA